jgi:hypothetical protein
MNELPVLLFGVVISSAILLIISGSRAHARAEHRKHPGLTRLSLGIVILSFAVLGGLVYMLGGLATA